jgi:hypothetical protein
MRSVIKTMARGAGGPSGGTGRRRADGAGSGSSFARASRGATDVVFSTTVPAYAGRFASTTSLAIHNHLVFALGIRGANISRRLGLGRSIGFEVDEDTVHVIDFTKDLENISVLIAQRTAKAVDVVLNADGANLETNQFIGA